KLTEMGSVFKQLINPYFTTVATDSAVTTQKYNFTVTADITNKPLLHTLLPTLQRLDPIHFAANFNSEKGWNADLVSPMIVYGDNRIKNFQVHVKPQSKLLNIEADIAQFNSGKTIALYGVSFKNEIADNKINFVLNIHDKASKNKYNIAGLFQQPQKNDYQLSLKPDDLLLNYDRWQIDKNNSINFSSGAINATAFNLKKNDEELRINSESKEKNSPLDVEFNKFLLSTFSAIAGSDSLALNGNLNGKIVVSNIDKTPTFVSQLTINDLSFNRDTLGNVSLKINSNDQNKFTADVRITGKGNDLALTGDYFTDKGNFDLNLKINKLELASIVGASMGVLKKASGSVNGEFGLKGTTDKPDINGNLKFSNAMITPSSLGNDFYTDNQMLQISHGVKFSNFSILDSAKNELVLDGSVNTEDYKHYNYALTINAKNFRVLNSAKTDNQLYYGKLYFNCSLNVKGTEVKPSVDGTIKIDEKTNITITLPQDEPGIEDRQGIIEFVNKKSSANDSLNNSGKDTTDFVVRGIDISTNIIVDSTAILNLIIDPTNGDALTVKGRATLVGGVDESGKTTLSGTYQLSNGSYNLSFSILKKKFIIQNGSTITWTGEATKANLNINAILIANTAPIDLVDDQLAQTTATVRNTYLQKLPFEVHLHIGGEIMKPQISFDIVLPEDKSYSVSKDVITMVQGKLGMIRLDSGELNKQVFALLLLNRFVGEDPFASDQAGINAESLARSSVSKILSQQLNQLATSLIKGVDVNFDLQSTDDYTTGQLQNRTDLNVNISKRLLNDRLTVTVGSDYELEGPQNVGANQGSDLVGNLGVDYKLSKDGRYVLRAYRKNDYDDIVEGYVVETGMGFIITLDYNKFNEIFGKKKKAKNNTNN
ncbi:MAG TPA: translocation/assembly module TamB domain-containing protein, partial [Puia sp.]|nr:translocation/assembly module TamB domain-containing protein [Puia sp.]